MNYLIITGGLGNQMFEYAFLLALRNKNNKVMMDISYYDYVEMHNGYELEHVFGIKESLINSQGMHIILLRSLNKIRPSFIHTVDSLKFNPECLEKPRKYLSGYWQDERYFKDIEDEVRRAFTFKDIDTTNLELAKEMQSRNSVSLHIRRGDYAAFGMSIIGEDYYERAINRIHHQVNSPHFYIFSDDETVSKNMADKLGLDYTMVVHNKGIDSYKDMFLMSQCRHNIIANSSFSWWGAWLNNYSDKLVIAPQIWDTNKPHFQPQSKGWILL